MKKLSYLKTWLLTALVLLGSGSSWGQYTGAGTFNKITSLVDLTDGYYVIVNSADAVAMNNTNAGTFFTHTAVAPSSGVITDPAAAIVWKIETNGGGRSIYNEASAKFVSYTGSSNASYAVDDVSTDNQRWTFTYVSNLFSVANVAIPTRILQYNAGSPRFACYTSAQQKFLLYRMVVSTPLVSVSTTSLSGFGYTVGSGPSSEHSFTVSGTNLSNNIVLTPPTNYEISTGTGGSFSASNPITLTQSSGSVASTTIYVRLKAGLSVGEYNSETITITSTEADSKSVTLSGNVTATIQEPTAHVTDFAAAVATPNHSSITVTWTDADGASNYLIKGSSVSAENITAPVDETAEADGTLVKNVASGAQSYTFTGLDSETTYYFKIYPYNGADEAVNYKTDGTVPSASATTSWAPLSAPAITSATIITTDGFTSNWGAVNGAAEYEVNVYTKTSTPLTATDLIISEYVEGSSNNKAIEIFNGTGIPVDLSNYSLKKQTNGAGEYTSEQVLSGTLADGDVFILANASSNATILAIADITNNTTATFNGNDAVALFKNGVKIDEVGVLNQVANWGIDVTLIRKSTINSPKATYDPEDWTVEAQDYIDNLGSHSIVSISTTPISGSPFTVTSATSKVLTSLDGSTAYYYTVKAKNSNTESELSSEKITITAIDEAVNVSDLPSCTSCDLVVATTGHLTVGENRTFNTINVEAGGKLSVSANKTLALSSNITLKSDVTNGTATLIDNGTLTVSGTSTVQQFLTGKTGTGREWWYIGTPVTGAKSDIFGLQAEGGTNKMGFYQENKDGGPGYVQILDATTDLVPGVGYALNTGGNDAVYNFSGTLKTGNVTLAQTRTETTHAKRGFNLIANPYPSYLDWDLAHSVESNLRPTIWYRTYTTGAMVFNTYNDGVAVPNGSVTGKVPPLQAFWVRVDADGTSGSLSLTNAMREHAGESSNLLRAPAVSVKQIVRLSVSNGVNTDETVLVTNTKASDNYDYYDSEKMTNSNVNIPEIFTLAGQEELVINTLNSIGHGKELILGFRPGKAGEFTIGLTEFANLDFEVVLKDKIAAWEQVLKLGESYSFSSDATATNERFSILFRTPGSITGVESAISSLNVYTNADNRITIQTASVNAQSVANVYNLAGQRIASQQLKGVETVIDAQLASGIYLVTVSDGVNKSTQRVVVK